MVSGGERDFLTVRVGPEVRVERTTEFETTRIGCLLTDDERRCEDAEDERRREEERSIAIG